MGGTDNVSIGPGIDASPFVKNASNPAPGKTLPQGFSMTQKLHAKTFPAGTLDDAPFTTTEHVRTLEEQGGKLKMTLKAGGKPVSIDYAGPPVFRNMKADKTKVEASPEKPKTGTWKQNEVQVSIDTDPAGAAVKYSIAGEALGCSVSKQRAGQDRLQAGLDHRPRRRRQALRRGHDPDHRAAGGSGHRDPGRAEDRRERGRRGRGRSGGDGLTAVVGDQRREQQRDHPDAHDAREPAADDGDARGGE